MFSGCVGGPSLSAAGGALFDHSREQKKVANDTARLRKYPVRFDIDWNGLRDRLREL